MDGCQGAQECRKFNIVPSRNVLSFSIEYMMDMYKQ